MIYLSISPISLHIQVKNDEPTAAEHGVCRIFAPKIIRDLVGKAVLNAIITHRIHGAAIYGNIYHQYTPNVSIYTSTMDPSWVRTCVYIICSEF